VSPVSSWRHSIVCRGEYASEFQGCDKGVANMQKLSFCLILLAVGCILLQPIPAGADTCVKYHKRAPVKRVCGLVVNGVGEKLKDVEITLTGEGNSILFDTKTDNAGTFSFGPIPHGDYTLHVKAHGYHEAQRDLRVNHSKGKKCKSKIDVTLGFDVCDAGTNIKGVDKPSDLDTDFQK
jgi:Carboxypeptidase regulatory-like domain